jgi:excinuclease ABC subunit C
MVVFEQGVPSKKLYRHFNIRSVSGPDDFASMEEVLTRRFNRDGHRSRRSRQIPQSALSRILLVDGGKAAIDVLEHFNLIGKIPVWQNRTRLHPRRSDLALFIFAARRDEAHRFAITSHRKQRNHTGLVSRLDTIPGIGPARRKALILRFGSIQNIKEADIDEIVKIPGITESLAYSIKSHLE